MPRIKVSLEGGREMQRRLELLAGDNGMRKQLRAATKEVGDETLAVTQQRVPVKSGALKDSGKVRVMVSQKKEDIRIAICYGGPDVPYARAVHELHPTQSKFLESAILEAVRTIGPDIVKKIDLQAASK